MANSIKDLKWEKGESVSTSSARPVCPNGHPLNIYVTKKSGTGRVSCPVCGWSDRDSIVASSPTVFDRRGENAGVNILTSRGVVDNSRGVSVVRR
jgi:hypothetical protein